MFESEDALFEILVVACSEVEAEAWQQHIAGQIAVGVQQLSESRAPVLDARSPLADEMRSVGKAYGRTANFSRGASVQRAATMGPLTELNQVIIKNTQAAIKDLDMGTLIIPRSQSVITPSHVPMLAPRRNERIHLETMLADVWTKDAIPFPGLGVKRGEYSMRASANHVIRKLSIASITSNFSRRSLSHTNISQTSSSSDSRRARSRSKQSIVAIPPAKQSKRAKEPEVVNFHTAPEAFLPEDFDLKGPTKARGRLGGMRAFTLSSERARQPFFESERTSDADAMKRSRSVNALRSASMQDTQTMPAASRSHTAMSNPEILSSAMRGATMPDIPDMRRGSASTAASNEERISGMGRRAMSRLARFLS